MLIFQGGHPNVMAGILLLKSCTVFYQHYQFCGVQYSHGALYRFLKIETKMLGKISTKIAHTYNENTHTIP